MTGAITVDGADLERLLRAIEVNEGTIARVLAGRPFALSDAVAEAEGAIQAAEERGYERGRDDAEDDAFFEAVLAKPDAAQEEPAAQK